MNDFNFSYSNIKIGITSSKPFFDKSSKLLVVQLLQILKLNRYTLLPQ